MSQIVGTFGIDPLPSGVEPWSIVAVLGTWLGAGLVAPFRSALAAFSVLALLAIMPARCRGWVAAGLLGLSVVGGLLVARWWTEASGIPDDRRIAIDEVAGLLIALLPVLRSRPAVLALVTVLFVAVDRIKPWPVSAVESADLPWSLGVMLDDVTAGLVVAGALAIALPLHRRHRNGRKSRQAAPDGVPPDLRLRDCRRLGSICATLDVERK